MIWSALWKLMSTCSANSPCFVLGFPNTWFGAFTKSRTLSTHSRAFFKLASIFALVAAFWVSILCIFRISSKAFWRFCSDTMEPTPCVRAFRIWSSCTNCSSICFTSHLFILHIHIFDFLLHLLHQRFRRSHLCPIHLASCFQKFIV